LDILIHLMLIVAFWQQCFYQ